MEYAFFIAAILLQYFLIYLAYLPTARKIASQRKIHQASFIVALSGWLVGILSHFIDLIPDSIAFPIMAVQVYHMGRHMLHQNNKQAWAACGIFVGLTLLIAGGLVWLMLTNDRLRMWLME